MMKKRLAVLLVVCLSIGITACSQQEEISEPPSQTEQLSSENQSQSASASSRKIEESKAPEISVSSSEALTEVSSSSSVPEPIIPVTKITVQPVSMTGEHKAFAITDNSTQDLVLGYFGKMQPCNPDPHMGGYVFEVSVTRNGAVEHYNLLSATNEAGNSYVVRDDQWYTADHALWLSIAAFYPKFDYENNQPIYLIEIYSKQGGRAIAYYEEPSLVWSEAEQEASVQILAYIDGMKASSASADETSPKVDIFVQGQSIDRKYICYNEKDSRGYCIVQYVGERPATTPGGSQGEYSGGGWFVAADGFFEYLDSLL